MSETAEKKEYKTPEIEEIQLHIIAPTNRGGKKRYEYNPRPIRKKRDFAQNVILFLACVGAGFFAGVAMVGAVLLYCLQAGPI